MPYMRILVVSVCTMILALTLIPMAGLIILIPVLFMWNIHDDGLEARRHITDTDISFLLWENE